MNPEQTTGRRDVRIAIMGAGPGGICMGIQLKKAGFENFVLLERADALGGTWRRNTYPGCSCDIPSLLYSFSFETKLDWSRPYGPQPEVLDYMEHCAKKYGILPHTRLQTRVDSAAWEDDRACWTLRLDSGESLEADVLVSAIGMFNDLAEPQIKGLDTFEGKIIHSARWDWDHDLRGETVGVIGSAASAVQLVPEIVKETGPLYLFQRTANWVMPKEDEPLTDEILQNLQTNPEAATIMRDLIYKGVDEGMTFSDPVAVKEMEDAVLAAMEVIEDPEVRENLKPQHPFGCKRPLLSNVYFEAFNRPNLELVTEGIDHLTRNSIVTQDGKEHVVDTVVLATGFETTHYLSAVDVRGRNGLHIEDAWSDGAHAYLGITTAGFPNLFMLYGPNTNNGSILEMIEAQVDYAVRKIQHLAEEDLGWVDVRPEPQERWNEDVQEAIKGISAWQANCNGYYRSPSGRIVTQWPHSMSEFRERTSKPDADNFESGPLPESAAGKKRPGILESI